MRINLCCSDQFIEGFVGLDQWTPPWATDQNFIKADLRRSWPLEDNSVDFIRAHDAIEHMPDAVNTMNELWRVLKPGGTVEIVVPTTEGRGAWQDPTHVSFWNRNSFFYYEEGNPHLTRFRESNGVKCAFKVLAEETQTLADGVVKLTIVLSAVKGQPEQAAFSSELKADGIRAVATGAPDAQRFAFSILHTSARPGKWREIASEWMCAAAHPKQVEYILVMDERWGFTDEDMVEARAQLPKGSKVIWNTGRRCYVDGVNLAAEASSGDVLIVNADDQYPCDKWDDQLTVHFQYNANGSMSVTPKDFVIEVSTGTPTEHEREILVMPILSRERYERFGWVLYPEYESMYADNDFCAMAKRDGVIIDARHLIFPHKHWINKQRTADEADAAQNRPEAYAAGEALFLARAAINFAGVPQAQTITAQPTQRKLVVACTPGDMFSMAWMHHWTQLALHIAGTHNLSHIASYSSDAGITRSTMMDLILQIKTPIDYVFWIDDDNVITPEQFEMLRADLDAHPELDAVVAWCWCGPNEQPANGIQAIVSCGSLADVELTEDGKDLKYCCGRPLKAQQMIDAPSDLIEIGYSGFPAVLMRPELLKKAGKFPFAPIIDDRCHYGRSGEDIAFFAKAWARSGARFAVDRRIQIPHFKRRPTAPTDDPFAPQAVEIAKEAATV